MTALSLALAFALFGAPKTAQKTQLKLDVKPAAAIVYVDGKRKGTGAKSVTLPIEPGRHTIRIVHNRDEHQEVVVVKKGGITKWSWAFEDDRKVTKPPAEQETEKPETTPEENPEEPPK
jgi:hypothetical protein